MQKILIRRVWRDLKENVFRYLALAALIITGMYLIVGMVAAAEVVIEGTAKSAEKSKVESGEFSVFVPLKKSEEKDLWEEGITLERQFYLDFTTKKGATIRVFQNRKKINTLNLQEGDKANKSDEIVLEKRFCEENQIKVGDTITLNEEKRKVVGIGSVPDYESPVESMSDASASSKQFGIAFVTEDAYKALLDSGRSNKSEEYIYAYRLNGKMTNRKLKDTLKEYSLSANSIEDKYFQEYWEDTGAKKDELLDGVDDLAEGSAELDDGLGELAKNNKKLKKASKLLLQSSLEEASEGLEEIGLKEELTEKGFEQQLNALKEKTGNSIVNLKINAVADQLKGLKAYKEAITKYTDGVGEASDGSTKLADGTKELQDNVSTIVDKYFDVDLGNLIQFVERADNPRIGAAADDQLMNKWVGMAAGVIILILFTYVISVFVIHGIEKESSVIGALYALGVTKKDLIKHYLMLPVIVTFVASIIGTLVGLSKLGVDTQMQDCYDYYSLPELHIFCPGYLLVYSLLMPPVMAAVVNYLVIRKRLSRTVLSLMRNEDKKKKVHQISLKGMGFVSRFRIRQMIKEIRTSFTVVFGMFICLLIVILALDSYVMCNSLKKDSSTDTRYKYMYMYKYPDKEVPEGGEACYAKSFTKEINGFNLDITLLGIDKNNPYFDAKVFDSKRKVVISSAFAQKNNLKKGDSIVLSDEEEDLNYAFSVEGVTQFSTGLYVFMNIDTMRELFGQEDDYYNVVYSDKKLSIPSGRLQSVTSKKEIEKSSAVFINMMIPMIVMLSSVSALIFVVVMYLMMKVMIDRSAFNISLIRIFGYRMKEVKKLYLNGNFYTVAIGAAICIPLTKILMDKLFPVFVANISSAMNLQFAWWHYAGLYAAILVLYFAINQMLVGRIKKIVPAELLKNRE